MRVRWWSNLVTGKSENSIFVPFAQTHRICPKCDWVNWRRRDSCMKCGRSGHAQDEYDAPRVPLPVESLEKRVKSHASLTESVKRSRSDASSSGGPRTPDQRSSQNSFNSRSRLDHSIFDHLHSDPSSQSSVASDGQFMQQSRQWPALQSHTRLVKQVGGHPMSRSDPVPRRVQQHHVEHSLKAGLPSSFLEQVWEQRGFGMLDLGYHH